MKTSHALIAATLIGCWGCQYELPSRPVLGYEFDDAACSDGVDNDQDQLTDCEDPDCLVGSTHCGEQVPVIPDGRPERGLLCRDQIDNDENGQFDCGDPACREQLENCCVLGSRMKPARTGSTTTRTVLPTAKTSPAARGSS